MAARAKLLRNTLRVLAFLLASLAAFAASPALTVAEGKPRVTRLDRAGITYHIVRAKPEQVRVLWLDGDGNKLHTLPAAGRFLRARGEKPTAIMNGGIFEPGHIPSGLLVQDGKTLRPINRRPGKGNFFLKPNGVFWIAAGKAGVTDTDDFAPELAGLTQAVQSGPLLLKGGKTHPAFNKPSKSRLHRNGVGVTPEGEIVFAMTEFRQERFPNLWEFADLFRSLGCRDALFLDGDLSQLRTGADIDRRSNLFASMIAVVAP